jgi:hypothetical protein
LVSEIVELRTGDAGQAGSAGRFGACDPQEECV